MNPSPEHTEAYRAFQNSLRLTREEWHDGRGYDLDALKAMTAAERDEVVYQFRSRKKGWREVDVLTAIGTPNAMTMLRGTLADPAAETRLHAADMLHEFGEMPDIGLFIARELGRVVILDGMVFALRLASRFATDEVRQALLRGARSRPDVAVHYAAMLCFITGVTTSDFDWSMRPFFLRFGEHSPPDQREEAFAELCRLTQMKDGAAP